MLNAMRASFGRWVVLGIIGLIVLVFLFFGVVNPSKFGGGAGAEAAGEVNGDPIPYFEYARALENRKAMLANLKIPTEQLKFLRIEQSVFQELIQRKLVQQEAEKISLRPSPKEIQTQITKVPAFQKDGAFSLDTYKNVLAANQWTPRRFEQMMESDLIAQEWRNVFSRGVVITDAAVERAYRDGHESVAFRYVLVSTDAVKKSLPGKTPADVEAEMQKRAQAAADRLGTAKEAGLGAKKTDSILRNQDSIKDLGYLPELVRAGFDAPASIDPKAGGKAKIFSTALGKVVAVLDSRKAADPKGLTSEVKKQVRDSLEMDRERNLFSAWYRDRSKKSRISQNKRLFGEAS